MLPNIKLIGYGLVAAAVAYAIYVVAIEPRNERDKLEKKLVEQKQIPTKIITEINKDDAQKAQEEIDELREALEVNLSSSGVVVFRGMHH